METVLYNQKGEEVGKVNLPEKVFGLPINKDLLYQVATSQMANKRQVLAHAKTRSEVRGGGKKPWRQKGTGRARHGSIRSPIWKGGGVTFGPTKDKNFKKKINAKMARKAMFVALSSKKNDNQLAILDAFHLESIKTKEMAIMLKNLNKVFSGGRVLIVVPENNNKIRLSSRNLPNVGTIEARNLNALEILSNKNLLLLKDSIEVLNKLAK